MSNTNKNPINLAILALALILLLSTLAYAKPFTDAFTGGLIQINDFFTKEQYKTYATAIDFFFFALLFISVYMIGVRYAFKEVKKPEKVIAVLLGLMTAFLLVLGEFSATILLPYIHWLLYLLLFMFYWWLLKGMKSKFWRFILALLLTLLTIGLIQGLFGAFAPDTEGFFKSLGKNFEGIQFPETPGVPDYLQDLFGAPTAAPTGPDLTTLPSVTTPTAEAPGKGGIFGSGASWWWIAVIPFLAGAIIAYRRGLFKGREKPARQEGATAETSQPSVGTKEETIDDLVKEVTEAIEKKLYVLKKIRMIIKEKEKRAKTVEGFVDLYHKKIVDAAFYLDPDHQKHKDLMAEHAEVTEILKIERELEKDLLELMGIEDELLGKGSLPLGNWQREKFSGRLIEATSIKTQKEWYGKIFIWYWYVKRLREHIEREYNERLRVDKEIAPELAVPGSIPDFYGKVFAKLDASFAILAGASEDIFREISRRGNNVRAILGWIESKNYNPNEGIIHIIKKQIVKYYVWREEKEKTEATIKLLSDAKQLEKWLQKGWATRWHDIKDKEGDKLVKIFEREKKMFIGTKQEPGLFKNLNIQLILLQHIRELLQALKAASEQRISMTQLQDIKIDKLTLDPQGNEQWTDVTQSARAGTATLQIGNIKIKIPQVKIQLDSLYSVHTRIQEGSEPLKVGCYVNKMLKGARLNLKKHDEARFDFYEIKISGPGEYIVTFMCISLAGLNAQGNPIPGQTVYERKDIKSIKIIVTPIAAPPATSPIPAVPPAAPAAPPAAVSPPTHPHAYTPPTPAPP